MMSVHHCLADDDCWCHAAMYGLQQLCHAQVPDSPYKLRLSLSAWFSRAGAAAVKMPDGATLGAMLASCQPPKTVGDIATRVLATKREGWADVPECIALCHVYNVRVEV